MDLERTGWDGSGGAVACGRAPLVDAIAMFLARDHAPCLDEVRAAVGQAIDEAGPEALSLLSSRLAEAGSDWAYYPGDRLARRIHQAVAECVLEQQPVLIGAHHLSAVLDSPLVLIANHLSYSDANAIEIVLQGAGAASLANRLTVVAGPKVYSTLKRRFSSLCFGTIKVPQSSGRASEDAVMNTRDVARAARRSLEVAHERLGLGEALLVFAEGARSRTGEMQPLLPGVARYLEGVGAWVVPIGLTGTECLFPIGAESLNPARITVRVGQPIVASALLDRAANDRRRVMDCVGLAIADLLPESYRGYYGQRRADLDHARELLARVHAGPNRLSAG